MDIIFFILKILALQIVVFAVIIFILKNILDGILIDVAIKKLEVMRPEELGLNLTQVEVTTHNTLRDVHKNKITYLLSRKCNKQISLVTKVDPRIKGGMIIKLLNSTIDCSLVTRLRESGIWRS